MSESDQTYYYASPDGQPAGPVSKQELRRLLKQGAVRESTSVLRKGENQWRRLSDFLPPQVSPAGTGNRSTPGSHLLLRLSGRAASGSRQLAETVPAAGTGSHSKVHQHPPKGGKPVAPSGAYSERSGAARQQQRLLPAAPASGTVGRNFCFRHLRGCPQHGYGRENPQ